MLETLTKGFRSAKQRLRGLTELNEGNITEALQDVRLSLLEADVEFGVIRQFLQNVREKALGEVVQTTTNIQGKKVKASAADHFIKICYDELEALMGPVDTSIKFAPYGITRIMMVGLQGSGKTTSAAKLARYIQKMGKKPMLVAADVYRPAAVEQLQVLGKQLGMPVYSEPTEGASPPDICERAIRYARANKCDTVIYDTAGRLAIDDVLMSELEHIKKRTDPENTFLVCDAMIGQDAVNTASEFNKRIGLDGIILTKLDGDARGGAALSIKAVTQKPIKFLGMGESLDKLEEFRPEGLASRILGFGDIVGLMKDFEETVDAEKAEKDAEKLLSGQFSLIDFVDQIRSIRKLGSLSELIEKMPFFPDGMPDGLNIDDRELDKVEALVNSMTRYERVKPEVIGPSRRKRIARGSGRTEREVDELIFKFKAMREFMGQVGKGGLTGFMNKMPGFRQLMQMKSLGERSSELSQMFGGLPMGNSPMFPGQQPQARAAQPTVNRQKAKNKRKQSKQARKKNR